MSEQTPWTREHRWINVAAIVTTVGTMPLLFLGGLVTSHEVGMAVPDWPTTFTENMFLYNFLDKPFGIQLEHTHRLAGSVVGVLTLILGALIACFEYRVWVRWLGLAAVVGVIIQGCLGGFRVQLNDLMGGQLAAIHGATAQAFFALLVFIICVTSRWWHDGRSIPVAEVNDLRRASVLLPPTIYAQICLGVVVRHAEGLLWPVHLLLGLAIVFASIYVAAVTLLNSSLRPTFGWAAALLVVAMFAQSALGIAALLLTGVLDAEPHMVISVTEAITTTTHVILGSTILGLSIYLAAAAYRRLVALPEESTAFDSATAAPPKSVESWA